MSEPTQPSDVAREAAELIMHSQGCVDAQQVIQEAITRALAAAKAENEELKRERDELWMKLESICIALPQPPTQDNLPRIVHEMRKENISLRQQLAEAQKQLNQQNP